MSEQLLTLLSGLFHMPAGDLKDDMTIHDIELWDSLKHMELVVALEQSYGVELSIEEITTMQNIQEIRRILKGKNIQC